MNRERLKFGQLYWYVTTTLDVGSTKDFALALDNMRYSVGNYFSTPRDAEAMASKLRAVLDGAEVIKNNN